MPQALYMPCLVEKSLLIVDEVAPAHPPDMAKQDPRWISSRVVSVRGRGGNSVVSARPAQYPNTWSSARA
jgi:hypothetical protein